jgi:D-alanyl-D-alanine carboxypeptidase
LPNKIISIIAIVAAAAATLAPARADELAPEEAGRRLKQAYPDYVDAVENGEIVWRDGSRMKIDDGKGQKSFEDLLADPDLQDIFAVPYPKSDPSPPPVNSDPGRARPDAFFNTIYGNCRKGEVSRHLVTLPWMPSRGKATVKITRINGVADKLRLISAELERLPASYDVYLKPVAGTYVCRVIAGTNRLSTHGHGIAIDLALKHAHYWRWSKPDASGRYTWKNEIPIEIVRIFEKHGFIWGGRWYHYDTMHFEYRPELLE